MNTATQFRYSCDSPDQLPELADKMLHDAQGARVFAFSGEPGAGKTTLISALCRALGVNDVVNSPTFTIVNEYLLPSGEPVYHFDFYRIRSVSEAFDIGFEQYLYSGHFCFIEWPEHVLPLLPDGIARIVIEVFDDKRKILMSL
jgi:tRNA threonylcarbamoyladenosine biosynthesis protein TsaE